MSPHTWAVRVRTETRGGATIHARNHTLRLGSAVSFEPTDEQPSALEAAVGALAADLSLTFLGLAKKRRITLDALEMVLNAQLNNPLVVLGVVGEEGHPGIQRIEGAFYVSADAEPDDLFQLWEETLRRSPLYGTFRHGSEVCIRLSLTV